MLNPSPSASAAAVTIRLTHSAPFICEWRCVNEILGQMNGSFIKTPSHQTWDILASDQWLQDLVDSAIQIRPTWQIDTAVEIVEDSINKALLAALAVNQEILEFGLSRTDPPEQ